MLTWFLKKLPARLTVALYLVGGGIHMVTSFLLSTVWGIFILSVCIYYYTKYFTVTPPLTTYELFQLADDLPSDFKVAILTATVTVFGFIIAFYTAMANWRNQMKAQMMLQISFEIESFFSTANSNINTASIYIKHLTRTVKKIEMGDPSHNISFEIGYHKKRASEFYDARHAISRATIEIHNLSNRANDVLNALPLLDSCLNDAIKNLKEIADKMWVHIPIVNMDSPDHMEHFMSQIDRPKYHDFISSCERNGPKIGALAGAIRGGLNGTVMGTNIFSYSKLVSNRKALVDIVNQFFKHT